MAFVRGGQRPPGSGRPKGGLNKTTRIVREIVAEALRRKGGARYLEYLDDELFVELLLRFVPSEIVPKLEREAIRRVLAAKPPATDPPDSDAYHVPATPEPGRFALRPWLARQPMQEKADLD